MNPFIKKLSILFVLLFVSSSCLLFFSSQPNLFENQSFSRAVYDANHQLLRLTLNKDEQYRLFTPLAEIPQQLIQATLLQEDQWFFWHYGINPSSIAKAFWQTYILHSRRIGASTITMQVARLSSGINTKTISGKLKQIIRAIQLEMHYSKNEILEAYFNLAPYGGNIEGIGAASLIYFHKPVQNINLPQAMTLSIIPQNPSKRIPSNIHLKSIRDHLFSRWVKLHPDDIHQKIFFDVPFLMHAVQQLPFHAPHFVQQVLNETFDSKQVIETSLDLTIQKLIERVTRTYIARKKSLGVHNAAVMLVDTRDMGVKALMGSENFFTQSISGQINGAQIKRSPGSTLKPFIYALALDQGLIHPNTVLKDVPYSYNGYNPENFDYDFMGPIKAKDALVLSRNIPAISLSSQLKKPNLHQFLEAAQIAQMHPESYYGLSLNLGGIELTMQELLGLYASLVNEGRWYPIHHLKQQSKHQAVDLLSKEASFLVLDMLKRKSPTFKNVQSELSWKTGTSSGYRDAWTVGAFGPYVLAVWLGNFDNTANPALIGKDIAAPLFFELIESINQAHLNAPIVTPHPELMNLKKVKVCKASGMLATPYCKDQEWTWFIPGKSPIKSDTIFREVAINNQTQLRTCHIDNNTRFEVFEFWPSDLLSIFKKAGIQRHVPPFFEPNCAIRNNLGSSPQITSPQQGVNYVLYVNSKLSTSIPLSAVTDGGIKKIYWFINESFVAATKPNTPFFWPAKPGTFVVRVLDDQGMSDARVLNVFLEG